MSANWPQRRFRHSKAIYTNHPCTLTPLRCLFTLNEYYIYIYIYIYICMLYRAGVKYVFVFANTNTNTNTAYLYLYLYLIKFQTMYLYLYLYLIHRIWCIWQIRLQIHFFPGSFSKHKFVEHKLTWIVFINMLKSAILFQNKCRGLILLIPIWWLCLCTWFGLSMSMWQTISITILTWTTLQCHLSK